MQLKIDYADAKVCRGWAFDEADPDTVLFVEIASVDGPVAHGRASLFREDLKRAAIGDGHHAFSVDISESTFAGGLLTATARGKNGDTASDTTSVPTAYSDGDIASFFHRAAWKPDYQALVRRVLSPAVPAAAVATTAGSVPTTGYPSRAVPQKMFAHPPELAGNPSRLVTAYVAYECYRTRMDEVIDLHGDSMEHLEALVGWYLASYLEHRKRKLPLSAAQIGFLNSPLPLLRTAHKISVVTANFVRRDLGVHWDLADPSSITQAIYWWCVERAPELKLEDSLIPDFYVDLLTRSGPAQRWLKFHTNTFVERFHALHPELHFLDMTITQDRVFLMAYLVVLCSKRPGLVRFLPRESISRLLGPVQHGSDTILLDHVLQLALGGSDKADAGSDGTDAGTAARLAVIDAIQHAGYSLKLGRYMARPDNGNAAECLDDHGVPSAPEAGLAVIGPMRAASGLGQATRLSAAVLGLLAPDLAVHDFDMDNPAPTEFMGSQVVSGFPCRAINLIHLNAESIPLAFAYLPQNSYRNSYNIGFFFWELTELPKCHRLALEMLDEIWVSSEYNRAIYAANTDIPVINVGMAVQPLPKLPSISRSYFGIPDDKFVLLSTFDSFSFVERKNPLAVVRAFQLAFPPGQDDVMLVLKTQNRHKVDDPHQRRLWNRIMQVCEQDARIVIMNDTLQYSELLALKQDVDCYVSLHRSEGWGFGMIEAMQLGVPVIATGYSGNMEFCNPDTALLVGYTLVEPRPHEYIFVERGSLWAEPSVEEAAAHMRTAYSDRPQVQAMARRARALVETSFSPEAISRRYGARLAQISENVASERLA